jgi:hypothetical protein
MNTEIYLILIAALATLAVVMLYARFSARAREKSFHHAPAKILFSPEIISSAPPVETKRFSEGGDPGTDPNSGLAGETLKLVQAEENPGDKPEKEEAKSIESDYFDELQEAAAGLAALMRSSPVGRVDPVIFAPDEVVETGEILEEVISEAETVTSESVSNPLAESKSLEPTENTNGGEVVFSLRDILGEAVSETMDHIDESLEALAALVESMGSGLVALGALEKDQGGDALAPEERDAVSEAA